MEGNLCPGGLCPGDLSPEGSLSRGRGLCLGRSLSRGFSVHSAGTSVISS